MATHQELSGISDSELIERMINTHDGRFGELFWSFFDEHVAGSLPDVPTILDVGCGPGLFLRDLQQRIPNAVLTGTDITPGMVEYAESVEFPDPRPRLIVHDVTTEALPAEDDSVDLLSMVAVLHVLDNPFVPLREIRRVLKSDGVFLLQDWIRKPLQQYLDRMTEDVDEDNKAIARERFLSLFSAHNKYTIEDWLWVLKEAGFSVRSYQELSSPYFRAFVCTKN